MYTLLHGHGGRPRHVCAAGTLRRSPLCSGNFEGAWMHPGQLFLLAGLALAVACGDSGGPDTGPLPDDATDAIGLTIRDEVEASLDALAVPTQLAPYGVQVDQLCAEPSDPEDTDGD